MQKQFQFIRQSQPDLCKLIRQVSNRVCKYFHIYSSICTWITTSSYAILYAVHHRGQFILSQALRCGSIVAEMLMEHCSKIWWWLWRKLNENFCSYKSVVVVRANGTLFTSIPVQGLHWVVQTSGISFDDSHSSCGMISSLSGSLCADSFRPTPLQINTLLQHTIPSCI